MGVEPDVMAGGPRLADIVTHFHMPGISDSRGLLLPVDFGLLQFQPVHYFVVKGHDGARRGGHGHRAASQVLLCISGQVEVDLAWQGERASITLDEQANAVLIPAPVWSSQTYIGDAVLLVFSDQPYNPDGYIVEPV